MTLVDQSESIDKDDWSVVTNFVTKTIEQVSGKEGEHLYSVRGFGGDADERFFSFSDYARNPGAMQAKVELLHCKC